MRTLAVLAFIALIAGLAIYASQRPTVARGEVIAEDLMKVNAKLLTSLACDPTVPIGIDGATFWCSALFKSGGRKRLHFQMARTGAIKQIGSEAAQEPARAAPRIGKSDPWE